MKKETLIILVLMTLIFACSSVSDEELYNLAQEKIKTEKYQDALKDFEQIVNEFPESKYYSDALYEIGKLYHGNVVKTMPQNESIQKAVDFYKKAYESNSNGEFAPKALFMAAFLQANELNQLDEARKSYNLFLEKFPDNELAASAEAELNNLGIPPEQILEKTDSEKEL